MAKEILKCKITVIRRLLYQDLIDEYRNDEEGFGICDQFSEGQEFIVDHPFAMPEEFCPGARADIRYHVAAIATGSDPAWIKQPGTSIAGCNDWFRPVIFKVERL
jgi:uncharacterized repeat protein (TIGR04076 family)